MSDVSSIFHLLQILLTTTPQAMDEAVPFLQRSLAISGLSCTLRVSVNSSNNKKFWNKSKNLCTYHLVESVLTLYNFCGGLYLFCYLTSILPTDLSASAKKVHAFGTNKTKDSRVMLYHESVRNAISGVTRFWRKTQTINMIASASRTKIMKDDMLNVRK